MECPKCKFDNPDSVKFCGNCGNRIEKVCSKCGAANPLQFKFCGECGHDISCTSQTTSSALTIDQMLSKIQRYLPGGLAEKILAQKGRIEGERRQVTVLFADMEGFTPLVEKLGPEEAYALMDQIYEILIHKVHEFEGTVNEMTGDGIMALFGAPIALEDAPQRGIRSALAIHREIARFDDRLKQQKDISPIRMRVGVHTGPVVVGTLGNDLRVEFKAVGDTVNLASRLQNLAEPGTTLVTEETFKLAEGLFRFENLGERPIKGKAEPVRVYQVIAPSSRRTRFDVSAERGLTRFMGRNRELEILLEGLERAKQGNGKIFSIVGEAGIGKSRFLYEFRKAASNQDLTFLESKCLTYGKALAYHPLSDLLKGNFGIGDTDTEEKIRNKVRRTLESLKTDVPRIIPYLLELLGVTDSEIDRTSLSPEGRKERTFEAIKQIIVNGARIRPLVIAIEDLHWADQSTEEALASIIDVVPGARVLIIFTYRPHYMHTWATRSYHNQINLNRLSNAECTAMLPHLLGTDDVDPDLGKLVADKTDGIPFFVEEFVKSLQDMQILDRRNGKIYYLEDLGVLKIPSTIHDVIMSRVDRLSQHAKDILQAGSAIEREFPLDLIRAVTGFSEDDLLRSLKALKEAELLYERGIYPRSSYIFRHALTREVVYESLLAKRRRQLHQRIGTAMEEIYTDHLLEHCEMLSEHFLQSEDFVKSADYARMAGKKAEKVASLTDAIFHVKKRIHCLEKLPGSVRGDKSLIDARTALGLYLNQLNHWAEAVEAVEPIARMARAGGYRKRLGQILNVMGCYYGFVEEDLSRALPAIEEALGIAAEQKDFVTLAVGNMWLGVFQAENCEFDKAEISLQRAVKVNTAANSLWGIASMKAQLAFFAYYWGGRITDLWDLASEALDLAEKSGDPVSRGMAHTTYGAACFAKGSFEKAIEHAREGSNLHDKIGMYGWATIGHQSLGDIYLNSGQYEDSAKCYRRAMQIYEAGRLGNSSGKNYCRLMETVCDAMLGSKSVLLDPLRSTVESNKLPLIQTWCYRGLGQLCMNLDATHYSEAEYWTNKAISSDEKNGARFDLGLDYLLDADLQRRLGKAEKERDAIGKAYEVMKGCGADGWAERIEEGSSMTCASANRMGG
jgi:class 3 adenylate cyclase/tetratricopeptide (TPR) repeat protein